MQAKVLCDPLCDPLDSLFLGNGFFWRALGHRLWSSDFCEQGASPAVGQGVPGTILTCADVDIFCVLADLLFVLLALVEVARLGPVLSLLAGLFDVQTELVRRRFEFAKRRTCWLAFSSCGRSWWQWWCCTPSLEGDEAAGA